MVNLLLNYRIVRKTICEDDEFVDKLRKAFDVPLVRQAC